MSRPKSASAPQQLFNETDHVQLSRLVTEHAWRTDHGHADTIHELYLDDGEFSLPSGSMRGRDALREWGRQIVDNTPWKTIRHVCGNMRFVYDSENVAIGTTVLTVFMVAGEQARRRFQRCRRSRHFCAHEQGWRFTSRRWVELFARRDALDLP